MNLRREAAVITMLKESLIPLKRNEESEMKKTQIYMILFCLISFALGCVADRMVLILTAPEPQETDPHEQIRISDQSVQVYDKDKWIEIYTV